MPVPTPQTITELQSTFIASYVGTLDPNFGVVAANIPTGDPLLALAFATTALATQEQAGVQGLYSFSRASTSSGSDLDSWLADFGFQRFQGSQAQAFVNIPTSTGQPATAPVVIPAQTPIFTQPIALAPSTVPSIYQFNTTTAVTIAVGNTQVAAVPVQAAAVGSAYNGIPANTPLQLGSTIPGAGNPAFTNYLGSTPTGPSVGTNQATDSQALADFILYIQSLELATLAAIIAAIQDAAPFQYGSNLALYDYATNQSTAQNITLAQPGQVTAVIVETGKTGQYVGSPDDAVADSVLQAMKNTVAFGITPLLYYATQYAVTAVGVTFSYSAAALTDAALTLQQLEALMTGVLQGFFSMTGDALAQQVFFSQIAEAFLQLSVTTAAGVVTGIVQDVNVPLLSVTTTGGVFSYGSATLTVVYGGTPGTRDPTGYLSMASTILPSYFPNALP